MSQHSVLIIGGGIAGLTAAGQLAAMNIRSVLVEKRSVLGGYAAGYACKATDTCVQCGACIVEETYRKVLANPAVEVFTDSRVTDVDRNGRFRIVIRKAAAGKCENLSRETDAVILAAGFKPFDPHCKPYGYGRFPNVLTNLDLERMLRARSIPVRPSDGTTPERIAFVQCVGSRDESLGHLWCSKVCCASALRMARLIKMRRPQSHITFFYIDIQTFGSDFQAFYDRSRNEVNMVRVLPGDVFPAAAERLRVTYFDPGRRQGCEDLFDMVVLSIGIMPAEENRELAQLFQLISAPSGFLQGSEETGVFTAGTVCGPKSIAESILSADRAALGAAEYIQRNPAS